LQDAPVVEAGDAVVYALRQQQPQIPQMTPIHIRISRLWLNRSRRERNSTGRLAPVEIRISKCANS
jgi:hypothetical protein